MVTTKHLLNICTMLVQRRRRLADVVQMFYNTASLSFHQWKSIIYATPVCCGSFFDHILLQCVSPGLTLVLLNSVFLFFTNFNLYTAKHRCGRFYPFKSQIFVTECVFKHQHLIMFNVSMFHSERYILFVLKLENVHILRSPTNPRL